jgi:hypothetical protein
MSKSGFGNLQNNCRANPSPVGYLRPKMEGGAQKVYLISERARHLLMAKLFVLLETAMGTPMG